MVRMKGDFEEGWKSKICDGFNTSQTPFRVCLKWSLVCFGKNSRNGHFGGLG